MHLVKAGYGPETGGGITVPFGDLQVVVPRPVFVRISHLDHDPSCLTASVDWNDEDPVAFAASRDPADLVLGDLVFITVL